MFRKRGEENLIKTKKNKEEEKKKNQEKWEKVKKRRMRAGKVFLQLLKVYYHDKSKSFSDPHPPLPLKTRKENLMSGGWLLSEGFLSFDFLLPLLTFLPSPPLRKKEKLIKNLSWLQKKTSMTNFFSFFFLTRERGTESKRRKEVEWVVKYPWKG